ncbi:MAG TPA: hypothetical protein VHH73_01505, partial [Verrucomicrobiae bacterium]|nr:hypothetical protein [Verrucomicrobiae bacterium]
MDGRSYKIFRRYGEQGCWYIHFQTGGKRLLRSLDTNQKGAAKTRAAVLVRRERGRKWGETPEPDEPKQLSTIGEIITAYQKTAAQLISERTLVNNVRLLKKLLRDTLAKDNDQIVALPSSILTSKLVRD